MPVTLASLILSDFCPISVLYAKIPAFYVEVPALHVKIPAFYIDICIFDYHCARNVRGRSLASCLQSVANDEMVFLAMTIFYGND